MKLVYLFSMIGLLGCCANAAAQEEGAEKNEFSISAQIRPRGEYRNGVLSPRDPGAEPAWFINNRARISMEYARPGLTMRFSAQHVGVWGQDAQIDKNGRFVLNEAWARIASKKGLFAQLGRQTLSYDDERILGGLDWNVAGRYHDALKLGYAGNQHQLHLILAFNQNDEKTIGGTYYNQKGAQPYKTMQTAWYHYEAPETPFGLSLLFLNLGLETGDAETQKADTRYLQTMGTYVTYKPARWNIEGAFYYQTGRKGAADVSAFMASIRANGMFSEHWGLVLGVDYLSGTKPGDSEYKAFDPLYGTHHKFYGAMDYFYASGFKEGYAPGLWDNQIGITYKPCPVFDIQANYHYFLTGVKLEGLARGLGSEVDLQVNCKIMKDVSLSAGYSMMFGTRTMDIVKGGSHKAWQDWGWLSLNINPRIFFAKW